MIYVENMASAIDKSVQSHFGPARGTRSCVEHTCDFDQSQLCSDAGPPIGEVAAEPWAEVLPRSRRGC